MQCEYTADHKIHIYEISSKSTLPLIPTVETKRETENGYGAVSFYNSLHQNGCAVLKSLRVIVGV